MSPGLPALPSDVPQECDWVRAKDLAEPPALFSSVEPADACQGALGDCWLIAALAGALAKT